MPKKQYIHIPFSPCNRRRLACTIARILSACIAVMVLSGCIRNEFRMIFSLPESVNSTYRMAYYASNSKGGLNIESAVAVAAGKGEVKGITRYPTLVNIYYGSSDIPAAIFYAERGDEIRISGPGADPLEWTISGNRINDELTAWRLQNSKAIGAAKGMTQDDAAMNARRKLNGIIARYVGENPDSPAAVLILFSYFDARLQPDVFRQLWHKATESGSFSDLAHLLARQDCDSPDAPGSRTLPDIVVQSHDNNSDTLRFASSGAPTFLYYWRRNDPDRKNITDSLKRLAAWRPDSASMPIADVALTADSAQWASDIHRDSLRHTVRAFSPRELADPQAIHLGVKTTPWFIVGSGKGKKAYAGPDLKEASRIFRSLRPKGKKTSSTAADTLKTTTGRKNRN